ncbi:hypothetical protein F441_19392 [Phytophthora nicotianae CJ01A1]|uniref:Uncharacterized protein n=1 Tax=Phytophthora nicotianae CJ01A1 TaxID=1317063 RepID=W2VZT8_PHYNI|nr:hypothetical protein F441_19392 [Phytophthora nicotianae CJ01A1]
MAEPYVDSKTFQLMWYQLTKQGWSFRKSVGLSNDQRYVPPDGNVKGTEGVDVFVGEKSLVKHCMQQGWFPEYLRARRPRARRLPPKRLRTRRHHARHLPQRYRRKRH